MPFEYVDDLDDPRLAVFRHVKATNQTRRSGLFVLEGRKLLHRLIACTQFPIHSVLAVPEQAAEIRRELAADVPVYAMNEARMSALVGYRFHLGVVSAGIRVAWPGATEVCAARLQETGCLTLAICPAVNDPENLGAIARICDVFGVNGVVAGAGCPDPLSRRVLRVSMGAVLRLPVWTDLEVVNALQSACGLVLAAASCEPSAVPFDRYERPRALGLVLGNEAQGIPAPWLSRCRDQITIPMRDGADSLNVAVAAGILLQALTRDALGDSSSGTVDCQANG